MSALLSRRDRKPLTADDYWSIYITTVPEEGGFWQRLFRRGPRDAAVAAICRTTPCDAWEARWILNRAPCDLPLFQDRASAERTATALREACVTCEVRSVGEIPRPPLWRASLP